MNESKKRKYEACFPNHKSNLMVPLFSGAISGAIGGASLGPMGAIGGAVSGAAIGAATQAAQDAINIKECMDKIDRKYDR